MTQFFKAHVVNSDEYPLPDSAPQRAQDGSILDEMPSEAEMSGAASDMHEIVNIVGQLKPQLQEMAAQVSENARQQGYNDGLKQAQNEIDKHLLDAVATLTEAQRGREEIARRHSDALADLAMVVARKVIGKSFTADPTLVAQVVEDTLRDLEPSNSLTVRVNSVDVEHVEARRANIERLIAAGGHVDIVVDDTIEPGGVVLATPVGEVDARTTSKLAVLEAAFLAERQEDAGA